MVEDTSLIPALVDENDDSFLQGYAGYSGDDTHDSTPIQTGFLRWRLMGASAGKGEGGKYYNSLEGFDVPYDEVPCVMIDGKNSRAYYAQAYDPKNQKPGAKGNPPDCRSEDGVTGLGEPGGECKKCPMATWGPGGEKPACALSYDRLIYDFHTNQLGIISFSKSKIRAITEFEKARKARSGGRIPMWGYRVNMKSERKDNFYVPKIEIVGIMAQPEAMKFKLLKDQSNSAFMRVASEAAAAAKPVEDLADTAYEPNAATAAY